jgi:hypothetical protein
VFFFVVFVVKTVHPIAIRYNGVSGLNRRDCSFHIGRHGFSGAVDESREPVKLLRGFKFRGGGGTDFMSFPLSL